MLCEIQSVLSYMWSTFTVVTPLKATHRCQPSDNSSSGPTVLQAPVYWLPPTTNPVCCSVQAAIRLLFQFRQPFACCSSSGSHSPAVPVQAAIRLLFQFRQPFACCSSSGSHLPEVPVQAAIHLLFQFRQPFA
jgi:hypothetical protein